MRFTAQFRFARWAKNTLYGLFAFALVLFLLEATARVAWTLRSDLRLARDTPERTNSLVYSSDLGWQNKPSYKGFFDGGAREFDQAGYLSVDSHQAADKKPRKIVFIGDSNTFGFGVRTSESFVEVVETLLPGVHTINLGVVGYSSYQGRLVFEKHVPTLKPDLMVVAFNFNDRRVVLNEYGPDSAAVFDQVYESSRNVLRPLALHLERSYLYRAMRFAMVQSRVVPGFVADADNVRLDKLEPRVDENAYRENLTWLAEAARRRGIPVLFVAMKDNPVQTAQIREGLEHLAKYDHDRAIAYLRNAVAAQSIFSDLARLYLAQAYRANGDMEKAKEVVMIFRPWKDSAGGPPIRLDGVYNDIMREVARQYDEEFVDIGKVLDDHPSVYIDAVHFNADGHRRVGQVLAARLSGMLMRIGGGLPKREQ